MKSKNVLKQALRVVASLATVAIFLLNLSISTEGAFNVEAGYAAQANMFGESKCYGGQLGGHLYYPKCSTGCPYETWNVMQELGTCSNGPSVE